jgi:hypothetical protein
VAKSLQNALKKMQMEVLYEIELKNIALKLTLSKVENNKDEEKSLTKEYSSKMK